MLCSAEATVVMVASTAPESSLDDGQLSWALGVLCLGLSFPGIGAGPWFCPLFHVLLPLNLEVPVLQSQCALFLLQFDGSLLSFF